ncbi:metallophosphoesterase domain-containing protein [Cavenderia fasciculata]|uniref:Metallophosphoesterase domain-containing protein n=1 Tax=Cavenderia fasciculata TaxID=261658 RepID=F4QC30_CACFS|nr:metallophosphoesterase domain-containing protein [Cavenderia fasciculata]EGG13517.1 metallophosphoesterase domain-containing protein [Cavenderia fasciculata]|eukprot:XP_004350221.1 metallophosphoesterase domain-containing protein [Cavenderia fasciculata]
MVKINQSISIYIFILLNLSCLLFVAVATTTPVHLNSEFENININNNNNNNNNDNNNFYYTYDNYVTTQYKSNTHPLKLKSNSDRSSSSSSSSKKDKPTTGSSSDDDDVAIFKIVQITDTHFGEGEGTDWGPEQDANSTRVMETILALEQPDLVVFTGDLITGNNIINNSTDYWKMAVGVAMKMGIPWATVFGNHDDLASGVNGTKFDLLEYDISLGSYSQFGPNNIPGVSNYYIPIYDKWTNDIEVVLWMFDSGDGECPRFPKEEKEKEKKPNQNQQEKEKVEWMDPSRITSSSSSDNVPYLCNFYITGNQVLWYYQTAKELYAGADNLPLAFAYFHVPIRQYMWVWNQQTCYGSNNDSVACQAVDGGLYYAFESIGDVKMVSVGHNHGNDYCGLFGSVELCYGRHSGYGGYGTWERGARVIQVTKQKGGPISYDTWLTFETGERLYHQPPHHPDPSHPQQSCTS